MIWPEAGDFLLDDEETSKLLQRCGEIDETNPPDKYKTIWKDISFIVQLRKARNYNLSEEQTRQCFKQLIKRPYYLAKIVEEFSVKKIIEVGTAEGLQFYSFAESIVNCKGHVWSCDILDKRNIKYDKIYENYTTFVLGDSKELAKQISTKEKIDLFYIDALHQKGSVLKDVDAIKHLQSENPIWIFDDFDVRFGCYEDIKQLCKKSRKFKIYRVGNAASGNPNHQVIIFGKL